MVIVGNPPYSVRSENNAKWITGLVDDYKKDLNEKKLNLDDDFIKFIRFSQWRIDETGHGILAFISNNVYFDGLTHRCMRKSLTSSFNKIYVLDLHGSAKKKEKSPDGSKDENVFDIQQGVGINFSVKTYSNKEVSKIKNYDLWGDRDSKYNYLFSETIESTNWIDLNPRPDYFFFVQKDFDLQEEYSTFSSLKNIFISYGSGVKTERDKISICWDKNKIQETIKDFRNLDEDIIREKYQLQDDSRDWKISSAKVDVKTNTVDLFHRILYRLFDIRHTWYSGKTRGFIGTPGYANMHHLLNKNLGLIVKRQARENIDYSWFFCCETLVIDGLFAIDNKGRESIFPLYLYLKS
jgi:predicted helicase